MTPRAPIRGGTVLNPLRLRPNRPAPRAPSAAEIARYRRLFEDRICDLRTQDYLRDPELVKPGWQVIRGHLDGEISTVTRRLLAGAPAVRIAGAPRIALSNHALAAFAGSELWTCDVATYLQGCGVPVIVYAPRLGEVAARLQARNVPVTSSVAEVVAFGPDIVHVNHFSAAAPLLEALSGRCRVLKMVHGLLPRPGLPGYSGVDLYACVSVPTKAKVHMLTGRPWSEIPLLPNFFDERRFTEISTPRAPRKAALLSGRTPPDQRDQLSRVLARLGVTLDHIGAGGRVVSDPERWLAQYDVVFAVGRSAIEALASGAHVVLWDFGVVGPAVTARNFWRCVASNFALASDILPWKHISSRGGDGWLLSQVAKARPANRLETTQLVRAYLPLSAAGARLVDVYRGMVAH